MIKIKKIVLTGGFIFLLAGLGFWLVKQDHPSEKHALSPVAQAASGERAKLDGMYRSKDTERVRQGYEDFVIQHSASKDAQVQDEVSAARMRLGYLAAGAKDFAQAKKHFEETANTYKGSGKKAAGYGSLKDQAKYQAAVCEATQFLTSSPVSGGGSAPRVFGGKDGKGGGNKGALAVFRTFIKQNPDSPMVHAAAKRMLVLSKNKLDPNDEQLVQRAIKKQEDKARLEAAMCGPRAIEYLMEYYPHLFASSPRLARTSSPNGNWERSSRVPSSPTSGTEGSPAGESVSGQKTGVSQAQSANRVSSRGLGTEGSQDQSANFIFLPRQSRGGAPKRVRDSETGALPKGSSLTSGAHPTGSRSRSKDSSPSSGWERKFVPDKSGLRTRLHPEGEGSEGNIKTLDELVRLCGTTNEGTTLEGMQNALKVMGLESYGYELSLVDFKRISTPAFWLAQDHYVVVLYVGPGGAKIYDPLLSHESNIPLKETLEKPFSATVLTLKPLLLPNGGS